MDTQLKKGFLEFCVLASLIQKDSYGYQIIKDVSQCIDISESTLYPILKRLENHSYVETYTVEHNGRLRKYYNSKWTGTYSGFLIWLESNRKYISLYRRGVKS